MYPASRVLLKQLNAKDITSNFVKHYGLNNESASKCKALLLYWSIIGKANTCIPTYYSHQLNSLCSDDAGWSATQVDSSSKIEVENCEEIFIKIELLPVEVNAATVKVETSEDVLIKIENAAEEVKAVENSEETCIKTESSAEEVNTLATKVLPGEISSWESSSKLFGDSIADESKQQSKGISKPLTNKNLTKRCIKGKRIRLSQRLKHSKSGTVIMKNHLRRCLRISQKCKLCMYSTEVSSRMIEHKTMHASGNFRQCEHCKYWTADSLSMEEHMHKHVPKLLQRNRCKYNTFKSREMRNHEWLMRNKYVCKYCNYWTTDTAGMNAHMDRHSRRKRKKTYTYTKSFDYAYIALKAGWA